MKTIDNEILRRASIATEIRKEKLAKFGSRRVQLGTAYVAKRMRTAAEENVKNLSVELANWFLVFDEVAEFYLRAWEMAFIAVAGKSKKSMAPSVPYFLLVGALVTQCFAIRKLCTSGFDVSAKLCARQLIETMDLLRAMLDDPKLASEFMEGEELEEAREFWYRNVSKGKAAKRSDAYRAKKFKMKIAEFKEMDKWAAEERLILSSAAHPSMIGAQMSFMRTTKKGEPDYFGATGFVSDNSVRTLMYVTFELIELVVFHPKLEFLPRLKRTPSTKITKKLTSWLQKELEVLSKYPKDLILLFRFHFRPELTRALLKKTKPCPLRPVDD